MGNHQSELNEQRRQQILQKKQYDELQQLRKQLEETITISLYDLKKLRLPNEVLNVEENDIYQIIMKSEPVMVNFSHTDGKVAEIRQTLHECSGNYMLHRLNELIGNLVDAKLVLHLKIYNDLLQLLKNDKELRNNDLPPQYKDVE